MNGNLVAGPLNTAVVVHESNATINCTTDSTTQALTWSHNSMNLINGNISFYPGYVSASQLNGRSALTINTTVTNVPGVGRVAGPYTCSDPSATAQPISLVAQLILLGTNSFYSLLDKFNVAFLSLIGISSTHYEFTIIITNNISNCYKLVLSFTP